MKTVPIHFLILCLFMAHSSHAQQPQIHQYSSSPTLTLDSASIFVETNKCIHAIAFDNKGMMYVGGCHDVYRITSDRVIEHFTTLSDTSTKTCIWSMTFDSKGDLYIAAFDRIVKVTSSGEQTVVEQEDFSGSCGVTDLRFDRQGKLLAVYDNIVARYYK
jgi:ligand-binding sensor domain-containing protein